MDTTRRVVKNTLYLGFANLCSPLISMVLIIFISRHFGADGLGAYSAALAFVFFFEKFAQLGIHQLVLRDIANDISRCKPYLIACTLIGLISSLVTLPALYLFLRLIHYSENISEGAVILSLSLPFVVLSYHYQSILEGLQRMDRRCLLSFLDVIIRVGLGVLLIHMGYGVSGALAAVVVSRIVTCLSAVLLVLPFSSQGSSSIDSSIIRSLLTQTLTFLMISLVTTVYWRVGFVMLSTMRGPGDVGVYSAAYRLMEILTALTYSYIASLYPIMASSLPFSPSVLKRQCELSIKYLFISTFPIGIGTWLLAPQIITSIYGHHFLESIRVLQILIWTICIFPLALVCARSLVATKHQKYDLWANIFLITSNIGANLALIPRFGPVGAAVATLLSVTIFLCIQAYFVSRILVSIRWFVLIGKPFLAGTIMGVFSYAIRHLNPAVVISLSAAFYVIILLILRTFPTEERQRLRNIFHGFSLAA